MKTFLQSLFFFNAPVKGAFAGIILFLSGTWLVLSVLVSSGKIIEFINFFCFRNGFHALALILVIPLLLLLYMAAAHIYLLTAEGYCKKILLQWKILIPVLLLWTGAAIGLLALIPFQSLILFCGPSYSGIIPEKALLPMIHAGIFLLFPASALTAKLYANAAQIPYKAMFGKWFYTVMLLITANYAVTGFTALHAYTQRKKTYTALETFFKRPLTCDEMAKLHRMRGKADKAFWQKANLLQQKIPAFPFPDVVLDSAQQAALEQQFSTISQIKTLADHMAAPLPPHERIYKPGKLAAIRLPELNIMRLFSRHEAWQARFAAERNDPERAVEALENIYKCTLAAAADHMHISMICARAFAYLHMDTLQMLLSDGLLSDGQLLRQKSHLVKLNKILPDMYLRAVYGESVMMLDFYDSVSRKIATLAWYLPPLYRTVNLNFANMNKLHLAAAQKKPFHLNRNSDFFIHASMLTLPWDHYAESVYKAFEARLLAMQTLIDIELVKRRTGSYPAEAAALPVDPFTGKTMYYKAGEIPMLERIYDQPENTGSIRQVKRQGIAVWSVGVNRKNDHARCGSYRRQRFDDPAAFLILK